MSHLDPCEGRSSVMNPPALTDRSLVGDEEAAELAALFRLLGSTTRLRLLHAIARAGEASVSELADAVGASTQSVSNHLQRMAGQQIVAPRREGTRVSYRLVDPSVGGVMELGLCLLGHQPEC